MQTKQPKLLPFIILCQIVLFSNMLKNASLEMIELQQIKSGESHSVILIITISLNLKCFSCVCFYVLNYKSYPIVDVEKKKINEINNIYMCVLYPFRVHLASLIR